MACVLIVDDDVSIANLIQLVVKNEGHAAETAHSVSETWSILGRIDPDLAIVDVTLNDGDGVELARRILAKRPKLRIILTTGLSDISETAPEFNVLEKPFHVAGLARIVARTLNTGLT